MSNLREAAQQALEALKDYKRSDDDRVSIAMHILSTALEQDEPEGVVCARCGAIAFDPLVPQRKPLTDEEEK